MSWNHLDWPVILEKIKSFSTSGLTQIEIEKISPCADAEEATTKMNNVLWALEVIKAESRPYMESLDLFNAWFPRIKKSATLKTLEIKDVRLFCLETLALREVLKMPENPWSENISQQLMRAEEPLSAIDQILTPAGEIRSDASEKLYNLFKEKQSLTKQISQSLDKLVSAHEMTNFLQEKYVTTREGRWVLPVKSGMQSFMGGVIHGSSQSKQTVYMEPDAIIPSNNRLRQVEVEIEDEIERILTDLSKYLHTLSESFYQTFECLLESDFYFSLAQWSQRINARPVQFADQNILLNDLVHPLLAFNENKTERKIISNTVSLDQKNSILLLSGPNAGGKTVLLKSIGLAAHMTRCGLPICTGPESYVPFFRNIHVALGDAQNIGAELSTFAAHLKALDEALSLSGSENLILVDEICGSTDPEEGSALARSFIEQYSAHSVFAVITSHLSALKTGWDQKYRVMNGSLEYDKEKGVPTYQFLQGIPGDSLALQTARRVGVPEKIITRAVDWLSPETRQRLLKLEEVDQIKNELLILRESLRKEKSQAEFEKQKYQTLKIKIEKEQTAELEKMKKQLDRRVDEMIGQAKIQETFKKHLALQEIKTQLPQIVKSQSGSGAPTPTIDTVEDFAKKYPPGSRVYIASLGQDGIIQSTPNSRGEIMVLSNSMRLTLPWTELKTPQKQNNPTADLVRKHSPTVTISLANEDRVLDLRGHTVEAAISDLEIELDHGMKLREGRLKVIHGHGTEALKKAIRTYLSRSVYVKKWKAGAPEQGGDGVTWVELET